MKKRFNLILGIIIGLLLGGITAYAATKLTAKEVPYTNPKLSGVTNVSGAIDELYTKASNLTCPIGYNCELNYNKNIVAAYTYNSSTCKYGTESTCVQTTCYLNNTAGSCPAGTIIRYNVNSSTTKTFNVLHDDGNKITMQDNVNVVKYVAWNSSNSNTYGPTTLLPQLESATSNWANVNDITYTAGTTTLYGNQYTGYQNTDCCSGNINFTRNSYTLAKRTAKARMITGQEVVAAGYKGYNYPPASWIFSNVSSNVSSYYSSYSYGYWTMSADIDSSKYAMVVAYDGVKIESENVSSDSFGARAVVEINKQ